jgi:hypothetical protein
MYEVSGLGNLKLNNFFLGIIGVVDFTDDGISLALISEDPKVMDGDSVDCISELRSL